MFWVSFKSLGSDAAPDLSSFSELRWQRMNREEARGIGRKTGMTTMAAKDTTALNYQPCYIGSTLLRYSPSQIDQVEHTRPLLCSCGVLGADAQREDAVRAGRHGVAVGAARRTRGRRLHQQGVNLSR